MPLLSRAHYRRELVAWSLLPVALGAIEGGVVGVFAKNAFADAVSPSALNMAVAILVAAQAFANIVSFIWAALSHGRHKIRALTALQLAAMAMIGLIAFAPFNAWGLAMLVAGVVGARVCWSGVAILRSTVWHANYPRHARARLAGKLATVQALVMAGTGLLIGLAMDFDHRAIRVAYPVAVVIGLIGVAVYSRLRMRGHRALLKAERASADPAARSANPLLLRAVLRHDAHFRHYMTCMFVFGFGNLMAGAPLIIMLTERFRLGESVSVVIATTIPLLLMPVSIPVWSRLLDRMHIIRFRAIHSWMFVTSTLTLLASALTLQPWLLFVAAGLKGIAFGGGVLGWNLGHHDFAPPERVSQYMGVHVTLTGLRGMTAPVLGVAIYQWLEWQHPGAGAWVFAVCLGLSTTGAIGFVLMARRQPRHLTSPDPITRDGVDLPDA